MGGGMTSMLQVVVFVAIAFALGPVIIGLVSDPYSNPTGAVQTAVNAIAGLVPLLYYGGIVGATGYYLFKRFK